MRLCRSLCVAFFLTLTLLGSLGTANAVAKDEEHSQGAGVVTGFGCIVNGERTTTSVKVINPSHDFNNSKLICVAHSGGSGPAEGGGAVVTDDTCSGNTRPVDERGVVTPSGNAVLVCNQNQ